MRKAIITSVVLALIMPLFYWGAMTTGTSYVEEFNAEEYFDLSEQEQNDWMEKNTITKNGLQAYAPYIGEVWLWMAYGKLFLLFFVPILIGTTLCTKRA